MTESQQQQEANVLYYTNKNKVIFRLDFVSSNIHSNIDLLWRYIPWKDNITSHVVGELNMIIWDRLLNEARSDIPEFVDEDLQITKFLPQTAITVEDDRELVELLEERQPSLDTVRETSNINVAAVTQMIDQVINRIHDTYKPFILIGGECAEFLEVYQKSLLMQVACYHMNFTYDMDTVKSFITCMSRRFLGIMYLNVSYLSARLCSKYTVAICQRGYGKTTAQCNIAAAGLVYIPNIKILMIAHKRDVVQQSRDRVKQMLKVFKIAKGCQFTIKYPSQGIEVLHESGCESSLHIASAWHDAALRGPDPTVCMVDETFSIDATRVPTITAFGCRNHCQLLFFTSPKLSRMLAFYRAGNQIDFGIFYRFQLFCTNRSHNKYSFSQSACVNLTFYVPRYLNFHQNTRDLTEILAGIYNTYNDEMGTYTHEQIMTKEENFLFREEYRTSLSEPSTYVNAATQVEEHYRYRDHGAIKVFIYVDPAYGGAEQSATSVVGSCLLPWDAYNKTPVLLYASIKDVPVAELSYTDKYIYCMIADCIEHCSERFGTATLAAAAAAGSSSSSNSNRTHVRFYVTMEANSSHAAVQSVYHMLIDRFKDFHHPVHLYYGTNTRGRVKPGYTLNYLKTKIFLSIINNNLNIGAYLIDVGVPNSNKIISEMKKQSTTFRHIPGKGITGKINPKTQDDLITTKVLSFYFSLTFTKGKFRGEFRPIQEEFQHRLTTGRTPMEIRNEEVSTRTVYTSPHINMVPVDRQQAPPPLRRRPLPPSALPPGVKKKRRV